MSGLCQLHRLLIRLVQSLACRNHVMELNMSIDAISPAASVAPERTSTGGSGQRGQQSGAKKDPDPDHSQKPRERPGDATAGGLDQVV
jgi:hypothetical protein